MIMLEMVRKKLIRLRDEAEEQMMYNSPDALEASGRYAACCLLLTEEVTPEEALAGISILPAAWPQRQGARKIFSQFEGLIE